MRDQGEIKSEWNKYLTSLDSLKPFYNNEKDIFLLLGQTHFFLKQTTPLRVPIL